MGLKIFQKSVGPLAMNATLVMDEESKESIFFDPGDEIEKILDIANEQDMNIVRLIATHCHVDHIAGANSAIEKLNLPLEISPLGKDLLGKVGPIAAAFGYSVSEIKEGGYLEEGDNVKIGGGSGVVKNIEDNQAVMGYPATPLREFLKNQKKK